MKLSHKSLKIKVHKMALFYWQVLLWSTRIYLASFVSLFHSLYLPPSFRELMRAHILRAGPSLTFKALIRWSSVSRSKACPSISWALKDSAMS